MTKHASWEERYDQLRAWTHVNGGRLPTRAEHKVLYDFITEVRKKFKNGDLKPDQISKLNHLQELKKLVEKWEKGSGQHHSFESNSDALERFVVSNGRFPLQYAPSFLKRKLKAENLPQSFIEEARLGAFLNALGRKHRTGELPRGEIARLIEIPGMEVLMDEWLGRALGIKIKKERKRRRRREASVSNLGAKRTNAGSGSKTAPATTERSKDEASECSSSSGSSSSSSSSSSDPGTPRPGNEIQIKADRIAFAAVKDGDAQPLMKLDATFMEKYASSLVPVLSNENERCLLFRYLNMRSKAMSWWPSAAVAYFNGRESALPVTNTAPFWEHWLTKEVEALIEALYMKGSFSAPESFLDYLDAGRSSMRKVDVVLTVNDSSSSDSSSSDSSCSRQTPCHHPAPEPVTQVTVGDIENQIVAYLTKIPGASKAEKLHIFRQKLLLAKPDSLKQKYGLNIDDVLRVLDRL